MANATSTLTALRHVHQEACRSFEVAKLDWFRVALSSLATEEERNLAEEVMVARFDQAREAWQRLRAAEAR